MTYYTGFKVNSGEHKLVGLAPYGEPRYACGILDHILGLKADGSLRLDQASFDYCTGLSMISAKFATLGGGAPWTVPRASQAWLAQSAQPTPPAANCGMAIVLSGL